MSLLPQSLDATDNRDFDALRARLISLLQSVFPDWSDFDTASFGNILSARNQKKGLPVVQTNAFGMAYGSLFMLTAALLARKPFLVDPSLAYLGSLFYLALFGSVIAFGCYLTLIGKIGADRAAYATLLFPVIALLLSTLFENYHWSPTAIIGVVVILSGNTLVVTSWK